MRFKAYYFRYIQSTRAFRTWLWYDHRSWTVGQSDRDYYDNNMGPEQSREQWQTKQIIPKLIKLPEGRKSKLRRISTIVLYFQILNG